MKLPNGERAIVEDAKLRGYVLNAAHPVGRLEVAGPKGAKRVVAVWIVNEGQDSPRLVTCFVE